MDKTVDFSELGVDETLKRFGELVQFCLFRTGDRAAVFIARKDGAISVITPAVLNFVPLEAFASILLEAEWTEDQVHEYLEHLDSRRPKDVQQGDTPQK